MSFVATPSNLLFDLLHHEAGTPQGTTAPATFAVGGTGTPAYWTKSFPLPKGRSFGMLIRLLSANTKNIKAELEQGNTVPGTENATDAAWAVTTELSAAITSTTPVIAAPAPKVTKYARVKFSTLSGNHADVVVDRLHLVTSQS